MNRDEFYASVVADTKRTDLTDLIPGWAEEVEQDINRSVRVPQMLKRATAAIEDGYSEAPADWLATRSFKVGGQPVEYAAMEDLDRLNDAPGNPRFYALLGGQFRFFPEPAGSLTGDLIYYAKIPQLATNETNWLLADHRIIYRTGILMRAYAYMLDEMRAANWERQHREAVTALEAPLQPSRINIKSRSF